MGPGWSGPFVRVSRAMLGPKRALGSRVYASYVRYGEQKRLITKKIKVFCRYSAPFESQGVILGGLGIYNRCIRT